jgi:excisionase family DNA binding protein
VTGGLGASPPPSQAHGSHDQRRPAAYLLPPEVAELLRVDVKTVYRWAADRRVGLPVVRIRGVVRFPREALMAWLEAGGQQRRRSRKQVLSVVGSSTSASPEAVCAEPCAEEGG